MSNEHSASVANLRWYELGHQPSVEQVLGRGEPDRARRSPNGSATSLVVASFLRDRSELWVAQVFSERERVPPRLSQLQPRLRPSTGRPREQRGAASATSVSSSTWSWHRSCRVPAPRHLQRGAAQRSAPRGATAHTGRHWREHKPFECVGDPDESAVALTEVSRLEEWRDVAVLRDLADELPVPSDGSRHCSNPKDQAVFRPTGFADLAGKRVGIFGYGVEGRATRRRLIGVANDVVLVDDAPGVDPDVLVTTRGRTRRARAPATSS